MSRSIHRTNRELAELKASVAIDTDKRSRKIAELRSEIEKKRRMKRQVRQLRSYGAKPAPTPVDTIPVRAFDASQYNHYPATANDIRTILRRLPGGSSDGLEGIELRAGAEYQREFVNEQDLFEKEPDPFTGRLATERMPGVFTPPVLGCYVPKRRLIYLFSYVYELTTANCKIIEFESMTPTRSTR